MNNPAERFRVVTTKARDPTPTSNPGSDVRQRHPAAKFLRDAQRNEEIHLFDNDRGRLQSDGCHPFFNVLRSKLNSEV